MAQLKKTSGVSGQILNSAVNALQKWNSSSLTLDECINDIRGEKAAVSILFLYFRHKNSIDGLIIKSAAKGNVKSPLFEIAACTLSQALFQTGISRQSAVNIAVDHTKKINPGAGKFMNALLRNALRAAETMTFSPDFPEKLKKRWSKQFGKEKTESIIEACNINPPLCFRMRGINDPPEGSEPITLNRNFRFYYHEHPAEILNSKLFQAGKCYIQDPATGMSVSLCGELPENAMILDSCAAPGGKTVMLFDKYPDASITAADKSEKRLAQMQENFKRLNVNAKAVCSDALTPAFEKESFDLVFIDAPCTNTGVMRRRPDAAWRFSGNRLEDTAKLQRKILTAMAPLVRSGGVLLYSTCSIEPEEDGLQVERFLSEHPEFTLEDSQLLLPDFMHDGAFAARLRKR
ncbi:MAG: methyltransferase domain-containing protein [Lentisphaerae bacterium]|nr:methyltransferase domain-containing protein [Lentisphaerota bacterium]